MDYDEFAEGGAAMSYKSHLEHTIAKIRRVLSGSSKMNKLDRAILTSCIEDLQTLLDKSYEGRVRQ